jgi:O-antigen/teichoic acid export membrane protein
MAQYVLAFVASALLARLLGPAGRGIYYLPLLAASTILAFCKLGVDQANIYLYGSRGVDAGRLSGQNAGIATVMGLLGLGCTMLLPWMMPWLFAATPRLFLIGAGLTVPLGVHLQLSAGLLSLYGRPLWPYRAASIAAIAQIAATVGLMLAGRISPGTALAVTVFGTLVNWSIVAIVLQRAAPMRLTFDAPLLRETLRHAFVLYGASLLLFLHLRLDMFMVEAWLGVTALGLYSLAAVLGETLMLATESIAIAILPGQVVGSLEAAAARALRASRAVIVVGGALALGWLVLGLPVIRIVFGDAYAGAYGPLVALLPGMITLGVQRVCSAPALRTGRPGVIFAISALSLTANALLNVVWIRRWGLYGASFASTVSYTASTLLFFIWTARLAGQPLREALRVTAEDRQLLQRLVRYAASLIPFGATGPRSGGAARL